MAENFILTDEEKASRLLMSLVTKDKSTPYVITDEETKEFVKDTYQQMTDWYKINI